MSESNSVAAQLRPMDDEELAGVSAGYVDPDQSSLRNPKVYVTFVSYCGEYEPSTGNLVYYPCPRCGRPMYTQFWNPKWECDPCNYSEFCPMSVIWTGSEESLRSAGKATCL